MENNLKFKVEDQDDLSHYAYHDLLTGLKNEKYFYENVKNKINNSNENDKFAVLYLKLINSDILTNLIGYQNSNNLITRIAEYIKESSLGIGPVSLYRGDEFLILFPFENNEKNFSLNFSSK